MTRLAMNMVLVMALILSGSIIAPIASAETEVPTPTVTDLHGNVLVSDVADVVVYDNEHLIRVVFFANGEISEAEYEQPAVKVVTAAGGVCKYIPGGNFYQCPGKEMEKWNELQRQLHGDIESDTPDASAFTVPASANSDIPDSSAFQVQAPEKPFVFDPNMAKPSIYWKGKEAAENLVVCDISDRDGDVIGNCLYIETGDKLRTAEVNFDHPDIKVVGPEGQACYIRDGSILHCDGMLQFNDTQWEIDVAKAIEYLQGVASAK